MRFYNPQFQQPISTFVPDATPWDMILKAGAAKEEAWAKGEAMPGELDVLEAALQAATGHEDWKKETVKKYRDQLNAIVGDGNIDYSDSTIQRKLKNVITSFGKDEDVLRIKRNKDYFDKFILPQLTNIQNQRALIFTPGYDPITHKYTGEQHRQDFDIQAISDPSTQKAYDEEASKVKADAIENIKQYGVQTGVDPKTGNPIIEKDLESHAVKQVLKEKVDRAMWDFTTAISGQDSPYAQWEGFWASKEHGNSLSQEELTKYMYDKYHKLGHKYAYNEIKNVEKTGVDTKKTKPGEADKDKKVVTPNITITASSTKIKGPDGNDISGTAAVKKILEDKTTEFEKLYTDTYTNLTKDLGVDASNIVKTLDDDGNEIYGVAEGVTLNPTQQKYLNQANVSLIQNQNYTKSLEYIDGLFREEAGLNEKKDKNGNPLPLALQVSTDEMATYNLALKEELRNRIYASGKGQDLLGSYSLSPATDLMSIPVEKLQDFYNNNLEDDSFNGTSVEDVAINTVTKKHPNSKLAKYEKLMHKYLTDHTYSTSQQYTVTGITDASSKQQVQDLMHILLQKGNSNEWSLVDDDKANLKDNEGVFKELMDALNTKDEKGSKITEKDYSFYFDRDQDKYVPVVSYNGYNFQYNGEFGKFSELASNITGYGRYDQKLDLFTKQLIASNGTQASLKLEEDVRDSKGKITKKADAITVRTVLLQGGIMTRSGVKIREGSYLFKVPGVEGVFSTSNDYELLGVQEVIEKAKKEGHSTADAFNEYLRQFPDKFTVVPDASINNRYFRSGK